MPVGLADLLDRWAKSQGDVPTAFCCFLLRREIEAADESGKIPTALDDAEAAGIENPERNPRYNVTLPDGVFDKLIRWARSEGNRHTSLAISIIERKIREADERGQIPKDEELSEAVSAQPSASRLEAEALGFIALLARGEKPTDSQIGELAHLSNLSEEELLRLRQKLFPNGARNETPRY